MSATPLADAFTAALGAPLDARSVGAVLLPADAALPIAAAHDPRVWALGSGSADQATVRDLLARVRAELGTPWPQPLASTAVRWFRAGERPVHEGLVFARSHRVSRTVVAAAAAAAADAAAPAAGGAAVGGGNAPMSQGDATALLDAAVDGLWLLCEQSTWCWPAHDTPHHPPHAVVTDVADPVLDLGASEIAAQLAWADHLLGPLLDAHWPGVRERLRREVRRRTIDPFVRRRDWSWIAGDNGHPNNWNPWIHGNLLVAALRLLDGEADRELRAHVVTLIVQGLDLYVATLPDDGAVDEGFHYWWNASGRLLEALALLAHATDGRLDAVNATDRVSGLPAIPGLAATVAFPHRMHLGGPWYLNVADGPARGSADVTWSLLHRLARIARDDDAAAHAAAHRAPGGVVATEREGLGRLLAAVTDQAWCHAEPAASPLPRETWLPSVQVLVARETAGTPRGLTLTVKGGHNDEAHNHNDLGSFVVASDGVPVVVDAGRQTYTPETFGPRRYDAWPMSSSWHNVPEVRGCAQLPGRDRAARDVRVISSDDGATAGLSLGLAGAYDAAGLVAWTRTATLDRRRQAVDIRDAWELAPWSGAPGTAGGGANEPPTTITLLLAGTVVVHDDAAAHGTTGPDAAGPGSAGPGATAPDGAGSDTAAPYAAGLDAAGLDAAGPGSAGPGATAPYTAGLAAGPDTRGPYALVTPLAGTMPGPAPRPVRIAWPAGVVAQADTQVLDDPMLSDVWGPTLTRLRLDVTDRRDATVTVTHAPLADRP